MSVVDGNEAQGHLKGHQRSGRLAGCRNARAGWTYIHKVRIDTSSLMSFPIKPFIPCCSKETPNGLLAVAEVCICTRIEQSQLPSSSAGGAGPALAGGPGFT